MTIGIDPHKQTHSGAAVDRVGQELSRRTEPAVREGFEKFLGWARGLAGERVWVLEDCRHVSGPFERFLIDHGETVVRLAAKLMAGARQSVREPGKSDPIDALAVARAALREGIDTLPAARLAGPELEIRLLSVHRERLVAARTRLINELRWQLHDLWPDWQITGRCLTGPVLQQQIARRLGRAQPTVRVRIARDMIRRVRELTATINQLHQELARLVAQVAPQLLGERGVGVLTAAKLIGEIADVQRFTSDAQLARLAGCAPIPVSSGRTDRHRLDRGGNRQLNHAIHMIALAKLSHDPQTAAYVARQRARGKTSREAIRCLKRHLIRRVYHLLRDPNSVPTTIHCPTP
ncbi:MAG TPA: IS110 family transposase [Solirubrobacteraceae bacterium]|nr:IS110 family transposase [Solirubrobacteraceae bacterium]